MTSQGMLIHQRLRSRFLEWEICDCDITEDHFSFQSSHLFIAQIQIQMKIASPSRVVLVHSTNQTNICYKVHPNNSTCYKSWGGGGAWHLQHVDPQMRLACNWNRLGTVGDGCGLWTPDASVLFLLLVFKYSNIFVTCVQIFLIIWWHLWVYCTKFM